MRRLDKLSPRHLVWVLVLPFLITSCIGGDGGNGGSTGPAGASKTVEKPQIEAALKDGRRAPDAFLVEATAPAKARPVRSLEETRDALANDPKLAPLRKALTDGGFDEEQRAQMVYFAGTHLSGAPADSIRHRQQTIHDDMQDELQTFRQRLADREKAKGVRIDRKALHEAGVVTTLEPTVVQ